MKGLGQVISEHSFFADLAQKDRELVAGCAQMAAFKAGEFLFRNGTDAENFFLLRHGRIALELQAPGKDPYRFETLGAGEVVGWSWLIPPYKWQFDGRAIEDTSVVKFDGKCLRGKCDADPRLGHDIMKKFVKVLAQRFSDTRLQLIDVYGKQSS